MVYLTDIYRITYITLLATEAVAGSWHCSSASRKVNNSAKLLSENERNRGRERERTVRSLCWHNPSHFSHNMDWTTHSQGLLTSRKCYCHTIKWRQTSKQQDDYNTQGTPPSFVGLIWSERRSPLILHHICMSINDLTTPVSKLQAGGLLSR